MEWNVTQHPKLTNFHVTQYDMMFGATFKYVDIWNHLYWILTFISDQWKDNRWIWMSPNIPNWLIYMLHNMIWFCQSNIQPCRYLKSSILDPNISFWFFLVNGNIIFRVECFSTSHVDQLNIQYVILCQNIIDAYKHLYRIQTFSSGQWKDNDNI